jgi:hypothetical protein
MGCGRPATANAFASALRYTEMLPVWRGFQPVTSAPLRLKSLYAGRLDRFYLVNPYFRSTGPPGYLCVPTGRVFRHGGQRALFDSRRFTHPARAGGRNGRCRPLGVSTSRHGREHARRDARGFPRDPQGARSGLIRLAEFGPRFFTDIYDGPGVDRARGGESLFLERHA